MCGPFSSCSGTMSSLYLAFCPYCILVSVVDHTSLTGTLDREASISLMLCFYGSRRCGKGVLPTLWALSTLSRFQCVHWNSLAAVPLVLRYDLIAHDPRHGSVVDKSELFQLHRGSTALFTLEQCACSWRAVVSWAKGRCAFSRNLPMTRDRESVRPLCSIAAWTRLFCMFSVLFLPGALR